MDFWILVFFNYSSLPFFFRFFSFAFYEDGLPVLIIRIKFRTTICAFQFDFQYGLLHLLEYCETWLKTVFFLFVISTVHRMSVGESMLINATMWSTRYHIMAEYWCETFVINAYYRCCDAESCRIVSRATVRDTR